MLYKKNKTKTLDLSLFNHPTSEYRATPFWAWNAELNQDEMFWQIEQLKKMGFGGFHMHVRCGLATPYLSKEFMSFIKNCTNKAKQENMLAWLYDEDRWPSGAAGGYVTKNLNFRQKQLVFTTETLAEKTEGTSLESECLDCKIKNGQEGIEDFCYCGVKLYTAFDVVLNADGTLKEYKELIGNETPKGTRWNVYLAISGDSGWYNGQAYVDTLMDEAVQEFIRVTHEKYYETVGEEFGELIPAIFTDEPQFSRKRTLPFAESKNKIQMPWTYGFNQKFQKKYGYEIKDKLPELLWDLEGEKPSKTRYLYHDFICELFTSAFADNCGEWCEKHGFYLMGHVVDEPLLHSQTSTVGEAMRIYRNFGIPGIDMLCNEVELSSAKQAQSVVHQYGKEGMMSELYGVTGWDFDFRGHKFQGDWQAALGVTVRVPHLAWYSMKGCAKRDFPASISYQSAWYKDYPYIENHFARLNTVLTRGKPCVNVGVIHPIESYWLAYGPSDSTAERRTQLENDFNNVIHWLLKGCIDFDFISESLLPNLYKDTQNAKISVGEMTYGAIVVPPKSTIIKTTIDALTAFVENGGKVIFLGECPQCVDAEESDGCEKLYFKSEKVSCASSNLLKALKEFRDVDIYTNNGQRTSNYIYNKRIDGETEWLFIANANDPITNRYIDWNEASRSKNLIITVKGEVTPSLYNTLSGEIEPVEFRYRNGNTEILRTVYLFDSLLFRLENKKSIVYDKKEEVSVAYKTLVFKNKVEYTLAEENLVVLDMPEWSEDGENYYPQEEILRIDSAIRNKYGYPAANGADVQPWVIGEQKPEKSIYLKFKINSEIQTDCKLAFEEAEEIIFNGEKIAINKVGYFVDKSIFVTALSKLKKGENVLIVKSPIGKSISLENLYLLGDFGVKVEGCEITVIQKPERIAFGSIVHQGLPFYGAGVTYKLPFTADKDGFIEILSQKYTGALIKAKIDGKDVGKIVFTPYSLFVNGINKGDHVLELELVASRVNTFYALHECSREKWRGEPGCWFRVGSDWSYEYNFVDNGILKSPEIKLY